MLPFPLPDFLSLPMSSALFIDRPKDLAVWSLTHPVLEAQRDFQAIYVVAVRLSADADDRWCESDTDESDEYAAIDTPDLKWVRKVCDFGISRLLVVSLSPPNYLLDPMWSPKLSDFGLARDSVVGTQGYMNPPDCMDAGIITMRADIYSLGVIIIEILTGNRIPKDRCYGRRISVQEDVCQDWMPNKKSYIDLVIHKWEQLARDVKPLNIMLHVDDNCVPKFSMDRTRNSLCDVKFTAAASANEGIEIKIGSHAMHVQKYLRNIFSCLKSMAPKGIFDMAKILSSSALPNNICKADWISRRPVPELRKVGTVPEYRKELTENESHHSVSDSCGAENGIKESKAKTSTAWVVATAAPHHATGNRNILSGFITDHNDRFVHAVDGVPMKVLAHGAVVTDAVVLPDVWFVPGLTANLVSVSQLAELDYSVKFDSGECCIRSAADGMIMGKAHLQDSGQYVLDFLKVPLAL